MKKLKRERQPFTGITNFLKYRNNIEMVIMKTKAIYEDGVLKPVEKLDLPEKTKVSVTIRESFSKLIEEVGEIEAKEDMRKVLESMRLRNYYG